MRGASLRPPMGVLRSRAAATSPASHSICRQCIVGIVGTVARRRTIQISSTPATEFPRPTSGDAFSGSDNDGHGGPGGRDAADARFEVLGSPYSLLSVSLSASQNLYTRRGTLVSVAGKLDNAQSTLSVLAPVRRALLGIPFLYQRVSSTTPLTLLIGTKAATTTLFTLHLDGTTDWVVAQRNALLAWTGHTLQVTPQRGAGTARLGLAHWGTSFVTGRGLVALSAPGYIYPVTLGAGEELAVHPSHVVAYAVGKQGAPQPFRLRSAQGVLAGAAASAASAVSSAAASTAQITSRAVRGLRFQVPQATSPPGRATDVATATDNGIAARLGRFWSVMQTTATYRLVARALFDARTVLRRAIWGDRLFVHVRGPATLLLSSRGVRVGEVLTRDNVNEIADADAGAVAEAVDKATKPAGERERAEAGTATSTDASTTAIHVAEVTASGKVAFTDAKDLKEFVR
ncbi:mitochondrial protein [Sporothrix brasiliensis 5110]|uniref:Altered inheritance of mitochondria protein 24, mitochondrial n=1 Tax=Sporothrix brasiliensis 5110 TaxID=1398154 RepID=A0A0C2FQ84_9PEZI|nr:mitochondrial protein [Sporothrix brasiliensis 5110]KIH93183.1 mitochondrial protein [Sporothrix brasiliensis 5110]